MPAWLIKDRLDIYSKKLKFDIFNNFYKFAVIRNPFDLIVSDYFWRKNSNILKEKSFDHIYLRTTAELLLKKISACRCRLNVYYYGIIKKLYGNFKAFWSTYI